MEAGNDSSRAWSASTPLQGFGHPISNISARAPFVVKEPEGRSGVSTLRFFKVWMVLSRKIHRGYGPLLRLFVVWGVLLAGGLPPAGAAAPAWGAGTVDHSIYGELLGKYVRNGVVAYAGLKREEEAVNRYLDVLERTHTPDLPKNEQLAFYINAYNVKAIKLVLMGYPGIKSIKEMGSVLSSPWKKQLCKIDGKLMSLDDIENQIVRPRFQDPRTHFALNCASKSCPPLLSEPYRGDVLDRQLDSSARTFINNPQSNYLKGNTLYVSKIFHWYEGDFKEGVLGFFMKFAEPDLKKQLEEHAGRIKIEYLDYDWSLNGK